MHKAWNLSHCRKDKEVYAEYKKKMESFLKDIKEFDVEGPPAAPVCDRDRFSKTEVEREREACKALWTSYHAGEIKYTKYHYERSCCEEFFGPIESRKFNGQ